MKLKIAITDEVDERSHVQRIAACMENIHVAMVKLQKPVEEATRQLQMLAEDLEPLIDPNRDSDARNQSQQRRGKKFRRFR